MSAVAASRGVGISLTLCSGDAGVKENIPCPVKAESALAQILVCHGICFEGVHLALHNKHSYKSNDQSAADSDGNSI